MKVGIRRVYDPPGAAEDFRVLVDRLWPRGIRKEELTHDLWEKDIAPSPELRKWFAHDPERWQEFRNRYLSELDQPQKRQRLGEIVRAAGERRITLLYGARDTRHNHALILAEVLDGLY